MGINADIAYADSTKGYWENILREMQAGNWDQFSAIDRAPDIRSSGDGSIYAELGGQLGGLNLTEMDHRRLKEAAAEYKEDHSGRGDPLSDPRATQELLQSLQIASPSSTAGGMDGALWGDPGGLKKLSVGGNDYYSTVGYDPGVRTAGGEKFSYMDTWEDPAQYGFTLDHYGNVYKGGEASRMDWLRQRDALLPEGAQGAAEWNSLVGSMTDEEFQQGQYQKAVDRYKFADNLSNIYTERKAGQNSNFFSSNLGKAVAIGAGLFTGGIGALGAWAPAVGGAVTGGALGAPSGNILGGALTGGALAGLGAYGLDKVGGMDGLLGGLGDYVPSGIGDLFSNSDGMIPFGDKTLEAFKAGITPTFEGAGIAANPSFLTDPALGGIASGLSGLSATNGLLPAGDFSFASTLGNSVPYSPMPGTHANGYNLNLPGSAAEQITPYFEGAGIGTPEPGVDYGDLAKQGLKLLGGAQAPVQGGGAVSTSSTAPFRGGQFNPTAQQARFQGAQLNPLLRRF